MTAVPWWEEPVLVPTVGTDMLETLPGEAPVRVFTDEFTVATPKLNISTIVYFVIKF